MRAATGLCREVLYRTRAYSLLAYRMLRCVQLVQDCQACVGRDGVRAFSRSESARNRVSVSCVSQSLPAKAAPPFPVCPRRTPVTPPPTPHLPLAHL